MEQQYRPSQSRPRWQQESQETNGVYFSPVFAFQAQQSGSLEDSVQNTLKAQSHGTLQALNPYFGLPEAMLPSLVKGHDGATFYARFGQAEYNIPTEEKQPRNFVRLEAISQTWFDQFPLESLTDLQRNEDAFIRFYSEAPIAQVELQFVADDTGSFGGLKELLPIDDSDSDPEQWFRITLGSPGTPAQDVPSLLLFTNLYAEGAAFVLMGIETVDEETRSRLEASVSTGHVRSATESELEELLQPLSAARIESVVVYDVGQGNAIGLCGEGQGVLGYFDLGGGCNANLYTFPPALKRFCFTQQPPVILSHWDEDHWSSANRDSRALRTNWIAPRQKLGPTQAAMIANIQAAGGRVWFLPAGFTRHHYGQIQLELATGQGRNNSGIVLTLAENHDGSGQQILMPGDAGYKFISSFTGGPPYLSVVASHHGGVLGTSTPPSCPSATHSRLVYSAGPANSYKHPLDPTRKAHHHAGWADAKLGSSPPFFVRETSHRDPSGLGHVHLGWSSALALPVLPCGTQCSLEPKQS
jgi:beta-lactamase superfamily II metal-dependent hydrolase